MILVKDGVQKEFSDAAVKFAKQLGWNELVPFQRPAEIGTRTKPVPIGKPIELIKPTYPGDEPKTDIPEVDVNSGIKPLPEVEKVSAPVKKTRKLPVRSKSVKK